MRATEIIRGVLDLIDQIECKHEPAVDQIEPTVASFKDVFAQLTGETDGQTFGVGLRHRF